MASDDELTPDPEASPDLPRSGANWKNRILFVLIFGGLSALIVGGFWLIRDVTPTPGPAPLPPALTSAFPDHAAAMRSGLSRRYQEDVRILKTAMVQFAGPGEGLAGRSYQRADTPPKTNKNLYFVRFEILGDEGRKIEAVVALEEGLIDAVFPTTFLDYGRLRRGHTVTPTPARKKADAGVFGQR